MAYYARLNCLKFSLVACFLLLLQPAFSQSAIRKTAEPKPDSVFGDLDAQLTRNQKLLGGSVVALIYKEGKIVYKKELGQDFTAKTQAPVAGSSQWITAALIMTLVDEGKISLDDPVTKYIPIYESYSKRYITIRNCLSHTTGIQAEAAGVKGFMTSKYGSLEQDAIGSAKKEIERNPGEMFFYSTIGPNIAGRIAEIVTKKTFDRLVSERLLRPLKMRQTTFYLDFDKGINPAGGANSSANDYMNFLIMLLDKGMFEGKRILSEKAIEEMQKMQTGQAVVKYVPKAIEGYEYGLGLSVLEKDASGKATVVSSPSMGGTWPYVDYCHGYACIFFVKTQIAEQKKETFLAMKEVVDQKMTSTCK